MKILVIGASGPIGYEISQYLVSKGYDVESTFFTKKISNIKNYKLDIQNKNETIQLIKKIKPDIVIHCVALSGVELSETNHKLSDTITVDGTNNVIQGCLEINCKIVYISSVYVYNEDIPVNTEEDIPLPKTYYGKSKLKAENLIKNSKLRYLILRTDQTYGWVEPWQKTNSVMRVLTALRQGKIFKEVEDWDNSPTFLPDIAYATEVLIRQNEEGIFNVTGSDFVNRLEWSLLVAEIFGLDKKLIQPIKADELNFTAKIPKIKVSNEKLFQKINFRMTGIKEGAIIMFKTKGKVYE